VVALIVDESKWLTASLGVALLVVGVIIARHRSTAPTRLVALSAMSLFFGLTVGTMAFGHLLAVTVKLVVGTLEGSVATFYVIGVALAAPSWWLVARSIRPLTEPVSTETATVRLNAWVAVTLLVMGLHNLPLAAPGLITVGYALQSRRAVGWLLVSAFVAVNLLLFVGSIVFLASGQSFEQFRGLE
jgi:hypothetical protein